MTITSQCCRVKYDTSSPGFHSSGSEFKTKEMLSLTKFCAENIPHSPQPADSESERLVGYEFCCQEDAAVHHRLQQPHTAGYQHGTISSYFTRTILILFIPACGGLLRVDTEASPFPSVYRLQ